MKHIVLLVRKECGGGEEGGRAMVSVSAREEVEEVEGRRGGGVEGRRGGVNPLLLTLPAELTVGSASNPTGLEFIDGSVSFYGM